MVNVVLFSEKTVYVHSQRTSSVQDGGRKPGFTTTLDHLLQSLLNEIRFGRVTKTAHRSLNFADTFEIGKRVDPACQIVGEIDLAFDGARVTFASHELDGHP